jgi:hypothetical protein
LLLPSPFSLRRERVALKRGQRERIKKSEEFFSSSTQTKGVKRLLRLSSTLRV